jgi:hypothetical protein
VRLGYAAIGATRRVARGRSRTLARALAQAPRRDRAWFGADPSLRASRPPVGEHRRPTSLQAAKHDPAAFDDGQTVLAQHQLGDAEFQRP